MAGPPATVHAAGGEKRTASLATLALDLKSPDEAKIKAALDALGAHKEPAAVAALAAFLRDGQPDALADRALAALGQTHSHNALPVLTEFTQHRRPSARFGAYAAIAQLRGDAQSELLALGLRDSDAHVRGLCARALGERDAKEQLVVLFRALTRGVPEAAVAIGKLGDAAALARFEEELTRQPIPLMLGGFEQFLLRADVTEAAKLDIVAHLGEVASVTVKRFLESLLTDRRWSSQPQLEHALRETAKRINAAPPHKGATPPTTAPSLTGSPATTGKP